MSAGPQTGLASRGQRASGEQPSRERASGRRADGERRNRERASGERPSHERASGKGAKGRRAAGRRPGESGTRAAIGEAARAQFADFGYHGATIRGIAAAAEVDPALIHHYYGTKEALFADAMRLPVVPSEMLADALTSRPEDSGLGAHLVRTALTLWESAGVKDTLIGLLRSAVTSEQASVMLREFIADTILTTVAKATGLDEQWSPAEAEFRASLVATQMLGLALTRLVLGLPGLTEASVDDLAAAVGPSVDRYLTGDIGVPHRTSPRQRRHR